MSWLRLDDDYHADGTLRRCRAVMWWPLILCALKRGGGVASADDLSAEVLADLGQGSEDDAARALDRLKGAGLLVECEGRWTTPGWAKFQPDPSSTERARRFRERNKAAAEAAEKRAESARDVTLRNVAQRSETDSNGDVTLHNAAKRSVTPDRTGHDVTRQDDPSVGGLYTSRERAHETATTPAPAPDSIGRIEALWRSTQNAGSGGALMTAPMVIQELARLVAEHGESKVADAIREAGKSSRQGPPTVKFLEAIVTGSKRGPASTSRAFTSGESVASPATAEGAV